MWGYPEFYIPVPGGYGTDTHGHLGGGHAHAPLRGSCDRPVVLEREWREGAELGGRSLPPLPAGDGGEEQDRRCRGDVRIQTSEEADVVAVDEHVQEARYAVAFEQCGSSVPGICVTESVECLAHGCRFDVDRPVATGLGPKDGRDADLRHETSKDKALERRRGPRMFEDRLRV